MGPTTLLFKMIIYKIKNIINNKIYIGMTKRTLHERWLKHLSDARVGKKSLLQKDIRRYGENNFKVKKICKCFSYKDMDDKERFYINKFSSCKHGYNLMSGGFSGGKHASSTRLKQSISRKTIWDSGVIDREKYKQRMKLNMSGKKSPRRIKVKCLDDKKEFKSIHHCAKYYGVDVSNLCSHLNGQLKSCRGMSFIKKAV